MPRRVKPYSYGFPEVPQRQGMGMPVGQNVQSDRPAQEQQQQPQIPNGLLKEGLKALNNGSAPAANVLPAAGDITAGGWANAMAGTPWGFAGPTTEAGFASMYPALGEAGGGLLGAGTETGFASMMPAISEGGLLASEGVGAGVGAGAAAAEGAGAAGSAAGTAGSIGPWAPITIAAMIAKSQVKGSDPGSMGGIADTLLMPSLDQWLANPGRSAMNISDPVGLIGSDVLGDDNWLSYLSGPSGILSGIFG